MSNWPERDRASKPYIRKGAHDWYCFGPRLETGVGATPREAYTEWAHKKLVREVEAEVEVKITAGVASILSRVLKRPR